MKDNNISVRDYTHLNGIESPNLLTPEIMEKAIVENFEKGKITEELFLGGMNVLEKGKRGQIGEIREWSGKRYQKTANGWTPVKEGAAKEKKEGEKTYDSKRDEKGAFNIPGQKAVAYDSSGREDISKNGHKEGSEKKEEKEFSKVNLGSASRAENILSDFEDEGFKEGKDYKIGELHRGDDIPKSIIPLNEKAQKRLLELKSEY